MNWLKQNPFRVAFAVVFGCLLTLMIEFWYESSPPNITVVDRISLSKAPGGDTLMDVTTLGGPARNCIRVSQHVLYTDQTVPRTYVPLATGLNGFGFGSVSNFEVVLDVPNGVTGDYVYVVRSAYFCTIWPGLLVIKESVSKPFPVHIT